MSPSSLYLVQNRQRHFPVVKFLIVRLQFGHNCVDKKRQASDSLHRKHQKGMQVQTTTNGIVLKDVQGFFEDRVCLFQPLQRSIKSSLMLTVRYVNVEMFFCVLEYILRKVHQHDVVLPTTFQVTQEPVRAFKHRNDVREQCFSISRVEILRVPERRMIHEMRSKKIQRL